MIQQVTPFPIGISLAPKSGSFFEPPPHTFFGSLLCLFWGAFFLDAKKSKPIHLGDLFYSERGGVRKDKSLLKTRREVRGRFLKSGAGNIKHPGSPGNNRLRLPKMFMRMASSQ